MKKTIIALFHKYNEDDVSGVAAQLTYYLILSFFPFIIALLQIIRFTPLGDMNVVENLLLGFPIATQELLTSIIKDVVTSGGATLFSIGLITAIWSASKGIMSLIKGVNRAYDLEESRPFWKLRLLSVVMTIGLIVLIMLSLSIFVFETFIFKKYLTNNFPQSEVLFTLVQTIIVLISFIFVFTLLYKFSPSLKKDVKITFKESLPGSVFATLGLILATKGFSIYVDNFGNYSKVYGSIGGVIVLLIWLYLASVIVILGAELNSIYMEDKKSKKLKYK